MLSSCMLRACICSKLVDRVPVLVTAVRCARSTRVRSVDVDMEFKPIEERTEEELARNPILKKKGFFKPKHTLEEQVRYMKSKTYEETYQGKPVWQWFRRNAPKTEMFWKKPRMFCIDKYGRFNHNNPCPICRDEYLFFDHRNLPLMEQFIIQGTIERMEWRKSGLCYEQYLLLRVEILKAINKGYIKIAIPFRNYDYGQFYDWWTEEPTEKVPEYAEPYESYRPIQYRIFPQHNVDPKPRWYPYWKDWDKYARKG